MEAQNPREATEQIMRIIKGMFENKKEIQQTSSEMGLIRSQCEEKETKPALHSSEHGWRHY